MVGPSWGEDATRPGGYSVDCRRGAGPSMKHRSIFHESSPSGFPACHIPFGASASLAMGYIGENLIVLNLIGICRYDTITLIQPIDNSH